MNGKILIYMPDEDWTDCIYHYSVMNEKQMDFMFKRLGFEVNSAKDGLYEARKVEFDEQTFKKSHFR